MQSGRRKWPFAMSNAEKKVLSLAYKGLSFVSEAEKKRIRRLNIEELDLSHNKLSYPTSCYLYSPYVRIYSILNDLSVTYLSLKHYVYCLLLLMCILIPLLRA